MSMVSMEIAQFCKSTYNNQLQQFIYLCLKLMATRTRSKVKSRSHHDVASLQPLSNVPTKYQLPTLYGLRDIAGTKF